MVFVISMDGPSGTGKSSAAKKVAQHFGFTYIDTGKLYRALAYICVKNKCDPQDVTSLVKLIPQIQTNINSKTREINIKYNNQILNQELLSEQVTELSSVVSSHQEVRKILLVIQRDLLKKFDDGVIFIGRDIGTVVFPKAPLKIFITAHSQIRAQRRYNQAKTNQPEICYQDILDSIEHRDTRDQTREHSPLQKACDAILIDTSKLNLDQVVGKIISLVDDRRKNYDEEQPLW